jgi:hypothetical protein
VHPTTVSAIERISVIDQVHTVHVQLLGPPLDAEQVPRMTTRANGALAGRPNGHHLHIDAFFSHRYVP